VSVPMSMSPPPSPSSSSWRADSFGKLCTTI
jgi:hypothetical protein